MSMTFPRGALAPLVLLAAVGLAVPACTGEATRTQDPPAVAAAATGQAQALLVLDKTP